MITCSEAPKVVPIVAIVEAKKDDIDAGVPQCIAELYAAWLLNKEHPARLYGCVTTGFDWKFLYLDGKNKTVQLDADMYFLVELPKLLGVLCHIIDVTLIDLRG